MWIESSCARLPAAFVADDRLERQRPAAEQDVGDPHDRGMLLQFAHDRQGKMRVEDAARPLVIGSTRFRRGRHLALGDRLLVSVPDFLHQGAIDQTLGDVVAIQRSTSQPSPLHRR